MNIQEILATLCDERKRLNEATTVLTGVTDQPKRRRLPKNPSIPPLRLSCCGEKADCQLEEEVAGTAEEDGGTSPPVGLLSLKCW